MPLQKTILLFLGLIFSTLFSIAEQRSETTLLSSTDSVSYSPKVDNLFQNQLSVTDSIINYGKLYLNKPYRYTTSSGDTFDCSGYTSFVYRNFGYNLSHSSSAQATQFDTVKRDQLKTGDLVFFAGRGRSKRVGHVGIVTTPKENGKFDFIHASCDRGITISSSEEPYYQRRFIKATRVIDGTQQLAINKSESTKTAVVAQSEVNEPVTYSTKKIKKTIPAKYHFVKSGENLSSIANKYGLTVTELKRKNGLKGSKLSIKQQLKVKDAETYSVSEQVRETANIKKNLSEDTNTESKNTITSHKIKKGETLFSISKLYNVSVADLKKTNDLSESTIHAGQIIKIKRDVEPSVITSTIKATEQKTLATVETVIKPENTPKTETEVKKEVAPKPEEISKVESKQDTKTEVKKEATPKLHPSTKIISHKVHIGENLNTIARDFKVSVDELKSINNLTDTKLHWGQEIIILIAPQPNTTLNTNSTENTSVEKDTSPVSIRSAVAPKTEVMEEHKSIAKEIPQETAMQQISTTYKVKKGDDLFQIAKKFDMTVEELKKINNLSTNRLNSGQVINVSHATETEEKPKVTKVEPKATTYKVKKGDNLGEIAARNNMTVNELKEMNNLTSNRLNPGKKLIVSKINENSNNTEIKSSVKDKTIHHKVKLGETLYSIAKKNDCSLSDLKDWNKKLGNKLSIGDIVIIHKSNK